MAESLLYITFKDTASVKNQNSEKLAVDSIAAQLLAAAERIKQNPSAIYDYIRQDSPVVSIATQPTLSATIRPITTDASLINSEAGMMDMVFNNKLKKTSKSQSIVKYFVQNSGIALSVDQIAAGASLTKNDLAAWLAQTGKRVPAIVNTSRGFYKFDPNKLITTTNANSNSITSQASK